MLACNTPSPSAYTCLRCMYTDVSYVVYKTRICLDAVVLYNKCLDKCCTHVWLRVLNTFFFGVVVSTTIRLCKVIQHSTLVWNVVHMFSVFVMLSTLIFHFVFCLQVLLICQIRGHRILLDYHCVVDPSAQHVKKATRAGITRAPRQKIESGTVLRDGKLPAARSVRSPIFRPKSKKLLHLNKRQKLPFSTSRTSVCCPSSLCCVSCRVCKGI